MRPTRSAPTCRRLATVVALALAGAACATAPTRDAGPVDERPTVRFRLDAEHVPAPPSGLASTTVTAWEALRDGRAETARQALQGAAQADDGPAWRTLEGFLALADGSPTAAQRAFQAALAASPGYAVALYGMGLCSEAGSRATAIDWYQRALAADPGLAEAAVRLEGLQLQEALAHLVRGEEAQAADDAVTAESAYRHALELAPSLLRPWLRLSELYREAGDLRRVVETLRDARVRVGDLRAVLEPLGEALQEAGEHAEAYDVYQRLSEVAPEDPRVRELVGEARRLYETTSLPESYRRLEEKPVIHRQDLAALIAIRIPGLAERAAPPDDPAIMTDVADSWAEPYIRQVVSWGVMPEFQNHTFQPGLEVKRQMFAEIAYRVLELIGALDGAPRARLRDVPANHFFYDEIQVVVGSGILQLDAQGRFGILEPVSGREAVAAVQRLARLARARGLGS